METLDRSSSRVRVRFGIEEGFKFAIGFWFGTLLMSVLAFLVFGTFLIGLLSQVVH